MKMLLSVVSGFSADAEFVVVDITAKGMEQLRMMREQLAAKRAERPTVWWVHCRADLIAEAWHVCDCTVYKYLHLNQLRTGEILTALESVGWAPVSDDFMAVIPEYAIPHHYGKVVVDTDGAFFDFECNGEWVQTAYLPNSLADAA